MVVNLATSCTVHGIAASSVSVIEDQGVADPGRMGVDNTEKEEEVQRGRGGTGGRRGGEDGGGGGGRSGSQLQ